MGLDMIAFGVWFLWISHQRVFLGRAPLSASRVGGTYQCLETVEAVVGDLTQCELGREREGERERERGRWNGGGLWHAYPAHSHEQRRLGAASSLACLHRHADLPQVPAPVSGEVNRGVQAARRGLARSS